MAYHFRKLKRTLRLIPAAKSIGFSTHFNEGDQLKLNIQQNQTSASLDETSTKLQGHGSSNFALSLNTKAVNNSEVVNYHFLLYPMPVFQGVNVPATYRDIADSLLHRKSAESMPGTQDPTLKVVRPVQLTSDDILLHLPDHFTNSVVCVSREQIPLDVITQHCRWLTHTNLHASHSISGSTSHVDSGCKLQEFGGQHSNLLADQIHYLAESGAGSSPNHKNNSKDGPSPEQMLEARSRVEKMVLNLFKGNHGYEMLHKNVILENNMFGDNKVAVGLTGYKLELFKLRLRVYAQFFSTSMEILSVTTLEQTGVVRIHWRLKGLPQIQNLKCWLLFQSRQTISKDDWEWLEAFSYFHIGKDGLVHKHRIDRMIPDDTHPDLTEKLRGLLNPAKPLVS